MDKKKFKEFMEALGTIAETSLIFYRNVLNAGGTQEEAMRLTQAFFAGVLFGGKSGQENGGGGVNRNVRIKYDCRVSNTPLCCQG